MFHSRFLLILHHHEISAFFIRFISFRRHGLGFCVRRDPVFCPVNAEQVLAIGRNVLSMEDYMLSIQYFNRAIKAKPYLADPYFFRAIAKLNLGDYKGSRIRLLYGHRKK